MAGPEINNPLPLVQQRDQEVAARTLPCVLTVSSVIQVEVGNGKGITLALREGRVLQSAVHGHNASVVGFTTFRPVGSHEDQRMPENPSIMTMSPGGTVMNLAIPLRNIICNLVARQDGKLFLPVMKTTSRP
jgi:hypothetical protein